MRELENLRRLTEQRDAADAAWRDEIRRRAKVYSTRAIADAAGVSHTAVWKMLKVEG